MTMFGGVKDYDDLYVLGVLSYGWIRGRGESSLGRASKAFVMNASTESVAA